MPNGTKTIMMSETGTHSEGLWETSFITDDPSSPGRKEAAGAYSTLEEGMESSRSAKKTERSLDEPKLKP